MSDKHQQAGAAADAWNVEEVGCSDPNDPIREYSKLSPWPFTDGDYLYSGGYVPHRCFMIIDLKDRTKPKPIAIVYPYDPIKSPPPSPGDPRWAEKTAIPDWDPGWNTHSHFVSYHSNILVVNQERYRYGTKYQDHYRGIKVYDVSDRHNPKFLSYFAMPGNGSGVHHFFFDGRYVYLGGEYEGFTGKILVIVDLKNPSKPVEAGKWWVPGQRNGEEAMRDWIQTPLPFAYVTWGQTSSEKWLPKKHLGLHYITVHEDRAYLAYHQGGFIILDVSDKSKPRFISRLDYHFPPEPPEENPESWHAGNSHSAKLVPDRKLIALSDEFNLCPFGWMRFVDISDEKDPQIISEFKYPENTCPGFNPAGNGPSTHIGNAWNENLLFQAWYKLGLRVIDITDPYHPVEVGHYVGPDIGRWSGAEMGPPGGKLVSEYRKYVDTYDVVFGTDGLLYVSDAAGGGLRVLRYTGPGMNSIQEDKQ